MKSFNKPSSILVNSYSDLTHSDPTYSRSVIFGVYKVYNTAVNRYFNETVQKHGLVGRFTGLVLLYLLTASGARLLAVYHWQGALMQPDIEGIYADLLVSIGFAGLTTFISLLGRWLYMVPLLLWWVLLSLNLELIGALNDTVDWYDFVIAFDPVIFLGSLQNGGEFTAYTLSVLAITLATGFMFRSKVEARSRQMFMITLMTLLGFSLSWMQTNQTSNWRESSPIARTLASWNREAVDLDISSLDSPALSRELETGALSQLKRPKGTQPNVLLIVLEGIPGLYVPQVAEYMKMKSPIVLESLREFARESLYIPNMVAHKRQTIRGLYAILCGDYSKLENSTPKAYEYIEKGYRAPKCLASILVEAGYQSHYLQAAPLAVMSKDLFMPAAGFETVLGTPYFKNKYIASMWGVDDRAFFEGASEYIEGLRGSSAPWFLTLLTVGTHHPYGAPPEKIEEYGDAKLAAVAYLDEALAPFLKLLEEQKLYDDTLVIITSDESHGLSNTMLGNNWGLGLVRGPGIEPGVNSKMYGLLDWPLSILDYLNLSDRDFGFIGRSVFRAYPSPRQLLFSSDRYYLAEGKQRIIGCTTSLSSCSEFVSENGELFAAAYETRWLDDGDTDQYQALLGSLVHTADASLFGHGKSVLKHSFIKDVEYSLKAGQATLLSGGQYLSIPAGKPAILELDIERLDDTANIGIKLESRIWTFQNHEDIWKLMATEKPLDVYILKQNEHLTLQYRIRPQVDMEQLNFDLTATAFGGNANLRVNKYRLKFPDTNQWEKSNTSINTNRPSTFKLTKDRVVRFSTQSAEGWSFLEKGWGLPESWGTWSATESPMLAIDWHGMGTADLSYCMQLEVTPYVNGSHPSIDVDLYLNTRWLGKWPFQYGQDHRPVLASIGPGLLREGTNEIRFLIGSPASPRELGQGNDTRRLGIALQSLRISEDQTRNCSTSNSL